MRVFALFFLAISFSGLAIQAQRKIISGMVKDEHSGEPVPFASIQFKNMSIGASTDSSGIFSIRLESWPSDTLVITCVGYQPYYGYYGGWGGWRW